MAQFTQNQLTVTGRQTKIWKDLKPPLTKEQWEWLVGPARPYLTKQQYAEAQDYWLQPYNYQI